MQSGSDFFSLVPQVRVNVATEHLTSLGLDLSDIVLFVVEFVGVVNISNMVLLELVLERDCQGDRVTGLILDGKGGVGGFSAIGELHGQNSSWI